MIRPSTMLGPAACVAALALAGCASGSRRLDQWLAREKARSAAEERDARAAIAQADPVVTVEALGPEEAARALGGMHEFRRVDPAWAIVRVRVESGAGWLLDADAVVTSGGRALLELPAEPEALSTLTDESWPVGVKHTRLATADAPWFVHVLTAGVLTVLTLHFEHRYDPPTDEQVRSAVPRALRLAALAGDGPRAGRCDRLLFLRRPAPEDRPLELRLAINLRPATGGEPIASLSAQLAIPAGGNFTERLGLAAAGLHFAAAPGVQIATRAARAIEPDKRCTQDYLLNASYGGCAAGAVAHWPTKAFTPFGLTPPPAPARLGTPLSSFAARPWWERTSGDYAPWFSLERLDASRPAGDEIQGGVADCKVGEIQVPGEDADKVYGLVELDGKRWRVGTAARLSLLTLGPRTTVPISFFDMDFWSGDDFLVKLKLARHGGELSAVWGSATRPERYGYAAMKCRLFDRAAVEAAFDAVWMRASDALDQAEEEPVRVRPDLEDLGAAKSGLEGARALVSECAGLVGWDDPRVRALVARWDADDRRFWSAARRSVESLPKDAAGAVVLSADKSPGDETRVVAVERKCGAEAAAALKQHGLLRDGGYDPAWVGRACLVRATIENRGPREFWGSWDGAIVLSDGRAIAARALLDARVAPGARGVITLVAKESPPPSSYDAIPWRLWRRTWRHVEIFPIAD